MVITAALLYFEDGEFKDVDIPEDIKEKFIRFGIDNPYVWRHD